MTSRPFRTGSGAFYRGSSRARSRNALTAVLAVLDENYVRIAAAGRRRCADRGVRAYTATMTSTLGLGGLLAGRVNLDRPVVAACAAGTRSVCGVILAVSGTAQLLIAAQVPLVGVLVTIGIHLSRLLHDLVPSHQVSGVSPGIGTMSW